MPEEATNTDDGVGASVSRGPVESMRDDDWTCDFDGARLKARGSLKLADGDHEVRECSAMPRHRKLVRVR